jgi:putative DNA primase/helicase
MSHTTTSDDSALMIRFTLFANPFAKEMKRGEAKWAAVAAYLLDPPESPTKGDCPLIKLATFGDQRTRHGSLRSNENLIDVYGVEGDYDAGIVPMEDAAALLRAAGVEAVICTTASHTAERPRWRVFLPLSRACTPADRRHFTGVLNRLLGGVLASESFTDSQAYYVGRVTDRPFVAERIAGIPLDLLPQPPHPLFPSSAPLVARVDHDDDTTNALAQAERDSVLQRVDSSTMKELRSALKFIPADDRSTWVSVGQALSSLKRTEWETEAEAMWIDWSATSTKHNPHADPDQWRTFTGSRSDYRAVFAEAGRQGWQNPLSNLNSTRQSWTGSSASASDDGVILVSADQLEPEAVSWLWNGWVAKGKLVVLAGAPGQGKTTLAVAIAAIVSSGGKWPDGTICRPGNVLIWSGEDDPADTLVPRLIAAGAVRHRVRFVQGRRIDGRVQPFDPATDMPELMKAAVALGDVALIVLDPVVSAVAGDSHKNTEVRRALQPVVDLAAALDAAVLGISHFTKGTAGRDPTERVTGSIAFGAVARIVLVAAKMQGAESADDRRILARAKSNIGPDDGGFIYRIEHGALDGFADVRTAWVVWGEPIVGSARELLADAETVASESRDERTRGEELMHELLKHGEKLSTVVLREMRAEGFSDKQARGIRERMQLKIRREGYGTNSKSFWALPDVAPSADSRAQSCRSGLHRSSGIAGHECDDDPQLDTRAPGRSDQGSRDELLQDDFEGMPETIAT